MAINNSESRKIYAGNGVTTQFAFPHPFIDTEDLKVLIRSSLGVETTPSFTVSGDFVTNQYPNGGTVTITPAPLSGQTVVIYREPELTQDLVLFENAEVPVKEVELRLDKLTMISQRLSDQFSRSLQLQETATDFDMRLPANPPDGATIIVHPDGDGFSYGPTVDQIAGAESAAIAAIEARIVADAAAAAAEASQAAVAGDLVTATSAATSASASAGLAAGHAAAAANTLTNLNAIVNDAAADAAATTIAGVNTAVATAETAATNASNSATAAANSATTASNAAASIGTSVTDAQAAATAAANSATAAETARDAAQAAADAAEAAAGGDFGTIETRLDGLEAINADARLDALEAAPTVDPALEGRIDALEAINTDARLDAVESAATGFDSRLDALEAAPAVDPALEGRVDALEAADTALDGRLDTAEATISSHTTSIGNNSSAITALQTNAATKTGTETLTNKTLTSPVITTPTTDVLTLSNQSSTPANPGVGFLKFYVENGVQTLLNSSGVKAVVAAISDEYVYNSSGITAAGATNTTSFATGETGALIGSIASTTTTSLSSTTMRVQFSDDCRASDMIFLEVKSPNHTAWMTVDALENPQKLIYQLTAAYGLGWTRVDNQNRQLLILFGNAGAIPTGAYGAAGTGWSNVSTWRWRVRRRRIG